MTNPLFNGVEEVLRSHDIVVAHEDIDEH